MSSPGRPRLVDRRRPGATPADEILDAAAELFTTRGYTATSTRAIADAVGLRQASLYTHFSTKAAILVSLLDTTVAPTLDHARHLVEGDRDPRETLLTLATIDVEGLLASRWNIGMLYVLPEVAGAEFEGFRASRSELRGIYRRLVSLCRPDLDPGDQAVDLPFRVVESVIAHRQDHPAGGIDAGRWATAATRAIDIG
ncbi:helix-turn-helix domain-containing protein [Rhodococcus sp. IEGM 1408]|uniref:TetR/AcrR family transcriptional regulator n=1 Tax=Rhodococcus sp. IEGM 1408 TaxID=3082220 RepID=UPI00295356F6|nr:helix-turn-helix domain-containing protein [Rhodococcus sp. IEGM 1408]MDV8001958.1 helix-turn-helix domain-containing protein [Rhodococcus sp. IEGM 1408]